MPFDFSVIMNQAAPFSLSSNPTALTIASPGGGANATITITPAAGFSGTVNVSCTVAYNGTGTPNEPPTCSLTPAQVSITSPNSANTNLSIASTPSQMSMVRPKSGSKGWVALAGGGGFMVAVVFAGFVPRQTRSNRTLLRRIGSSHILDGRLLHVNDGTGMWRWGRQRRWQWKQRHHSRELHGHCKGKLRHAGNID